MNKERLTPHQKVARAAKLGRGVRLSADEAFLLGEMDDAVATRAENDDEADEAKGLRRGTELR